MKYALLAFILTAALPASAQQTTTTTNCNVFGNQLSCTSTSIDDSAARAAQAERQRENDEAMRQAGAALGAAFARGMQMHKFHKWEKKYCKAHPGASWWYQFDMMDPNTRITGSCDDSFEQSAIRGQRSEAEANSWHTQKYCENDGFVWVDGVCHTEGSKSKSVSTTPQGVECPCDRTSGGESCRKAWQCK